MGTQFFLLGAISAGLGVALGAFGAHGLRARLTPEMLAVFETGVRYQMYHALALLIVGTAMARVAMPASPLDRISTAAAGWLFVVGTLLFSGSLYALSVTGTRWWGAVTPIGGVAFLVGWLLLILAAARAATVA